MSLRLVWRGPARSAVCLLLTTASLWSCGDDASAPDTAAGGTGAAGNAGSSGKAGQPSTSGGNGTQGGRAGSAGADAAGVGGELAAGGIGGEPSPAGEAGAGGEPDSAGGASGVGGGADAVGGAGGAPDNVAGAGGAVGFDIGDIFGHQPGTVERSGSITKSDNVCVVVFSGGMCLAQNSPACNPGSPPANVTLSLTLDAQGQLTVEAPYQDMCTSDYVGGVVDENGTPTGAAVATSYAVPLDTTAYYAPRSIDHCRIDSNGIDSIVQDEIKTWIDGTDLYITQLCTTHFTVIDPIYGVTPLTDTRSWTTKVALQ